VTLFPAARWRGPVPNQGGTMGPIHGLVLHIQEGSESGTDAWFHNPASKVSAHFGNPKSGPLDQWVEIGTVAWAEVDGNSNWISVETEGHSGDSLTPSQLENAAQLLAFLHTGWGVPLQISDSPASGTPGLTGHGLGGSAWGGHYDCPGAPILAQRGAIIARAQQILGADPVPSPPTPTTTEDDMPAFATGEIKPGADVVTMVCPPPANLGRAGWGDVWFSLGSDFGEAHVRVAIFTNGQGWSHIYDDVLVSSKGDRVNPFGGPLPTGVQKISIRRVGTSHDVPMAYLVEAAHR
jgi:hypothetical protein